MNGTSEESAKGDLANLDLAYLISYAGLYFMLMLTLFCMLMLKLLLLLLLMVKLLCTSTPRLAWSTLFPAGFMFVSGWVAERMDLRYFLSGKYLHPLYKRKYGS